MISWPTATVLLGVLALAGVLVLADHTQAAVLASTLGAIATAFNLLVYGSTSWLSARMATERYAKSNLAFALFLVGVLNSFTNYVHHTYHLPQDELPKWIAFTVSMLEAVIQPTGFSSAFATDGDVLWRTIAHRKGGRYALIATMPFDPRLN